jgi:hypothetical protein
MKKLILAVSLSSALVALAEDPLGVTFANDGGAATNQYTSPPTNTWGVQGPVKLTVWCDQDSLICVNRTSCSTSSTQSGGIPIPANIPVTTYCTGRTSLALRDGGGYLGCVVANAPNTTDAGVWSKCYWSSRTGNEGP